ncbi:MAG: glycosyl hydrolase 53 family protein [Huintestinicola sp.]|uniref:glycosyl hydrolase 53 family protein n=1 Tax=Huintestinicola sp. TaxID=2981661 RepID=UPI003EFE7112
MKKILAFICSAAMLLSACGTITSSAPLEFKTDSDNSWITGSEPVSSSIYVDKIDGLSTDFIRAVDISSVLSEEKSGVVYKGFDGSEQDIFKTLKQSGINYVRVRVWNDPFDAAGNSYGGGGNDVSAAAEIGKRAAENGIKTIVDFHYSDFWADPSKQMVPKAWADMDIDTKSDALYSFTKESLESIIKAGADVGMVQIGNETTGAMCGETNWIKITGLMNAGAKAVRETDPNILIAVHFTNPEKPDNYEQYAKILANYNVDYDVFASSYYSYWHGTLDNLTAILKKISEEYDKYVMVAEMSYAYTSEDGDDFANTIGDGGTYEKHYQFTVQGQADGISDVIQAVHNAGEKGIGVCYWEPAWIPVPGENYDDRFKLWEQFGSGWASSYAGEYDPGDAGVYYGGSSWDNQALFAKDGTPLESLKTFGYVYTGTVTDIRIDAISDCMTIIRLGDDIILPETADAIYNNGERKQVKVEWESYDESLMQSCGANDYTVNGTADGMPVKCTVSMVEPNYIENYSFENKDYSMWNVINVNDVTTELDFQEKSTDAKTGNISFHFYSENKVDFRLEQTVKNLKPGAYNFSLSLQGGDCANDTMYIYAIADGKEYTQETGVVGWANWQSPSIKNIATESGEITVGIAISCDAKGWGTIDDVLLNPVER